MKNKFSFFLIAFGIISLSFIETELKKIIAGKGITDEIIIGETTRTDIEKKYGTDFIEHKNYIKEKGDSSLYSTYLHYDSKGLRFYFIPAKPTLWAVYFYSKFPAITEKGIQAGVSTMQDVEKAYGEAEWYTAGKTQFKEYNGISFYIPYDANHPLKDRKAKKMNVNFIGIKATDQE